jgi:hypothetical protein
VKKSDYNKILSQTADYNSTLETPKALCPNGGICLISMKITSPNFTGLLSPGHRHHGILRMTSALQAPTSGVLSSLVSLVLPHSPALFPCCAVKFPREGVQSGNLLFAGKKTGQEGDFFFEKSVCTLLTEKVSWSFRWILNIFRAYSRYPTELGVSDFTRFGEDGVEAVENRFPFAIALKSNLKVEDFERTEGSMFVDDLIQIPGGTVVYGVYCVRDPTRMEEVQRIGEIRTESAVVLSGGDSGIFFKHQRREEDFEIMSDWREWRAGRRGEIGSSWFDNWGDDGS